MEVFSCMVRLQFEMERASSWQPLAVPVKQPPANVFPTPGVPYRMTLRW